MVDGGDLHENGRALRGRFRCIVPMSYGLKSSLGSFDGVALGRRETSRWASRGKIGGSRETTDVQRKMY